MSNDSTQLSGKEIIERESGGPDVFQTLKDIVEHPAKKWTAKAIPKDEDPKEWIVSERVSGVVDYIEGRQGDYGPFRVVELRRKDGDRVQVAGFGTVLAAWFPVLKIGDGLAITYRGTKPSATSGFKDFDDFEVVVVRGGQRISRDEPAAAEGESDAELPPGLE